MSEPERNTPEIDPGPIPEGNTVIDEKLSFEPERLSYEAAGDICWQIAERVSEVVRGETVVVADLGLLTSFSNLAATGVILGSLKETYQSLTQLAGSLQPTKSRSLEAAGPMAAIVAPLAPVTTVIAGIQAALGIVRFFREDVEFRGAQVDIDPLAFSLALAAKLRAQGAGKVFVPELFVLQPTFPRSSSLVRSLEEVLMAQRAAWQAIGPIVAQLSQLNADLDQAVASQDQPEVNRLSSELAALRRDLDPVNEALDRADQGLAQVQAEWQKPDPESGLTGLARLLHAEALLEMKPLLIHAEVVASGGHHRIARSAWRNMFQGDGLSAMGGAVARWALLAEDGSINDGGILSSRRSEKFPKAED